MLPLALRLARRELRGGLRGFRVFLACLALGVAAIATVQSVADGIRRGLAEDGQAILGGDLAVRVLYNPAAPNQLEHLQSIADTVSLAVETRAMARNPADDAAALVELKAVDGEYPLFGTLDLSDGSQLADAIGLRDGRWGVVADEVVLTRLGLAVGDPVTIGELTATVRGVIAGEPDRAGGSGFSLAPRLMMAGAALAETGLVQPGSMLYYDYRLELPAGADLATTAEDLRTRFAETGWRVRDARDAAPQLRRTIDQLDMFLTLVGLSALLVGGVGIGNAVKSYLDGKSGTIATLKCLGASGGLIVATYLVQILVLAAGGIAIGLAIGALAPLAVDSLIAGLLPVRARIGVYPGPLALAAAFGLLTALAFSLWPLARARGVPAAALFRDLVAPAIAPPGRTAIAATALAALALAGLAVATANDRWLALGFVGGAVGALFAFRAAAWGVMALARRVPRPRRPGLRLALANLHRPGAPTPDVVLSLGLGLTVLVAIALVQGNLDRQVRESLPDRAPSFFLLDIQRDQMAAVEALAAATPGAEALDAVASLRGRIVAVNGRPAGEALVDPEYQWLLRGDRGVTYSATREANHEILSGAWWPADYAGPPLVSVYEDIARAFGIGVGDRITVNILGRDIEAEIASVRAIDWTTLGINFTLVFSPKPLDAAPHTWIATVKMPPGEEEAFQRTAAADFPNVTLVRLKDALDTVNDLMVKIGTAVRSTAGVTLLAGSLVLAGAVAAGHRRRVYDAVVLKVLGATRADVLRAFLLEYGLLGLATAAIAIAIGTAAAWAVLTFVMEIPWAFLPWAALATGGLCTVITLAFGFVGTWIALGQRAAPLLRNE